MKQILILIMFFCSFSILNANPTTIKISAIFEGRYNSQNNSMIGDSAKVYIRQNNYPYLIIDSSVNFIGNNFEGYFSFNNIITGNYFITLKHRNSIQVWSNPGIKITRGILNYYDFTKPGAVYANNVKFLDNQATKFALYSGDINQDGIIDVWDISYVENHLGNEGYDIADLSGDDFVDASDLSIIENNIDTIVMIKNPPTTLTYPKIIYPPIKSSTTNDILLLPYTSVIKVNDTFFMYYLIPGLGTKLDTSLDGINWKFKANVSVNRNNVPSRGDSLYSIIYKNGLWYSGWTCHAYVGSVYTEFINIAVSTNGVNFTQYSGNPLPFRVGEDLSFFNNIDSFYCYIRPAIPMYIYPRQVGLMKSRDFINWTKIDTIIKFSNSDYTNSLSPLYLKQPYNMNVIKIGNDWWGFMQTLRIEDDGTEAWRFPYTELEETVETLLMYSNDGKNWKYTNNKKPFIPLHDSIKQVYALPTIVNDSLYIYSFESSLRHAGYSLAYGGQAAVDFAKGKKWKIFLYKFSINDLNFWKP